MSKQAMVFSCVVVFGAAFIALVFSAGGLQWGNKEAGFLVAVGGMGVVAVAAFLAGEVR